MATYLVERDLPGVTMEQLAAAQKRAIQVGKDLTAQGREVRYIRRARSVGALGEPQLDPMPSTTNGS